jgi:pilus assembly protein FimV
VKKQALSLAVLVAGAYPVASNALSLGDIRSNSSLNQPLRAKIELLSASAQEAQQLQVRLAPSNVFSRVGVDRPAFLNNLRFSSTIENGKPVILVTSDAPISEPFVNFLLEVSWPNGQLLKEYTVMLDPPVLMQPGTALAGQEAAVRAEPRPTGLVNRAATPVPPAPSASPTQIAAAQAQQQQQARQRQQAQQQAQARQQQAEQQQRARQQQAARQQAQQQSARQQPAAAPDSSRTYRVRRGDTLFKVATRLRQPGVNVDQMMMALYRANPGAFIGKNINGLKAGAVLQAPSAQAAKSASRAQARRQVRQQYTEWKKFRSSLAKNTVPQQNVKQEPAKTASTSTAPAKTPAASSGQPDKARLEVLGKADKAAASGAAAGSAQLSQLEKDLALAKESLVARQRENKELKSRIGDLESMLRKKNRLIALRDDQLAQLQKQLAAAGNPAGAQPAQQNAAVPGATDQPRQNVVPRTAGETRPAETGRDIQNQVANTTQAEQNKVVRAQAQENQQPSQNQQDKVPPAAVDKPDASAATTPESSPFADAQGGDNDLLSLLSSPMAWKIGAGALASLLLLWLLSRLFGRRKTKGERIAPVTSEAEPYGEMAGTDVNTDGTYTELEAELDKAEKRGAPDNLDDLDDDPFGTRLQSGAAALNTDDIIEAESAQDEDEVLMEANVYIAYGLHQQAESELKKALDKHPERLEYRHKLLENYFASNNRDEFDSHAEAFLATPGADRNGKMWREIAEWGAKISPDNKLYQQTSASDSGMGGLVAGAATAVAAGAGAAVLAADDAQAADDTTAELDDSDLMPDDLSDGHSVDDMSTVLDGLQDEELDLDDFDFDLDELESELSSLDEFNTDDDLLPETESAHTDDALIGEGDDEAELANTVDDSFDFSLDDLAGELEKTQEQGLDASDDIGEGVAAEINELDETLDEALDFDALLNGSGEVTAESADQDAQDDDEGGISAGLAAGAAAAAGAATAAVMSGKDKAADALDDAGQAIDDLFDSKVDETAADNSLDFIEQELAEADPESEPDLSDDDLNFDMDELPQEAAVSSADEEADEFDEFDFNLDELDPDNEENASASTAGSGTPAQSGKDNVTNLNLHLDQDSGLRKILPQDTFYAPEEARQTEDDEDSWLGDIDDALSFLDMPDEEIDLHEAHISTKLDLARAYLDMGDIEGARSTLEEVMVEGNDNQRREAETLLHETG